MATVTSLSEDQVVTSREQVQQANFAAKRTRSLAIAVLFGLTFIGLLFAGNWAIALGAFFLSLIGISNYFEANGHLHSIQSRQIHHKRLARDFSKLEPEGPAGGESRDPGGVPSPAP